MSQSPPPASGDLDDLGVVVSADGGTIRVFSATASAMDLCLFGDRDETWVIETVPMTRDGAFVWSAFSPRLTAGRRYSLRASGPDGPTHRFNPALHLLDPYARGLTRTRTGRWRSSVVDDAFDWGGVGKPQVPLEATVLYEAHAKGLTRLNPAVPEHLRGTYAGLAHETTIDYLTSLGVTTLQLLPVHQFVTERRLAKMGLSNYWGYNTLGFFSPHIAWASHDAQHGGPAAVLREFKGMVRLLHEAGLEVVLDVVFNHTAEEGIGGPTTSFRGLDNATYYRQSPHGEYIDMTGCGNTVDFSHAAPQRLVLDCLRYWANEVQVDGFRFDLATALGRDADGRFDPAHPLLQAIVTDPQLRDVKMIAEPWDLGPDGWQTGSFPPGWLEWNDGYRDRVRDFWLTDIASARQNGQPPIGIGPFATVLSGSSPVFSEERGPVASINFITAHDGFTAFDLTAYNTKHNLGNGEDNRDGTDNNRSFNHGVEGPADDPALVTTRRKAMRNLLATLLLSAGTPMLTAGDELGRSQRGNNNAYCRDDEVSWLPWELEGWQRDLIAITRNLLRIRRESPALRPRRFWAQDQSVAGASELAWYNSAGQSMSAADWDSPAQRTLQYLASSAGAHGERDRILLIVHGLETEQSVTLPVPDEPSPGAVTEYELLFNSAYDDITPDVHAPGSTLTMSPTSMQVFRAR